MQPVLLFVWRVASWQFCTQRSYRIPCECIETHRRSTSEIENLHAKYFKFQVAHNCLVKYWPVDNNRTLYQLVKP